MRPSITLGSKPSTSTLRKVGSAPPWECHPGIHGEHRRAHLAGAGGALERRIGALDDVSPAVDRQPEPDRHHEGEFALVRPDDALGDLDVLRAHERAQAAHTGGLTWLGLEREDAPAGSDEARERHGVHAPRRADVEHRVTLAHDGAEAQHLRLGLLELRRDAHDAVGEARAQRRRDAPRGRSLDRHSGMFPCFLGGRLARFVRSARSALITATRVAAGSITPSSSPRSAARNGDATL